MDCKKGCIVCGKCGIPAMATAGILFSFPFASILCFKKEKKGEIKITDLAKP
jgi:hypothetical protein